VKFFQQAKIIQDTLTSGAVDNLVHCPVAGDSVIWGEGREEMAIEFVGRGGGEPAKACEALSFLVSLAVAADCVVRREDLEEMIGHAFVREFRKAA
jgi:hypothetical protein